jgi:S-adenosylmethionine synthetase
LSAPQRPTQVTIEYKKDPKTGTITPLRVDTVVVSVQHAEEVTTEQLRKDIREKIIPSVIPAKYLDDRTVYHIQPSGRFVIGGPQVRLAPWQSNLRAEHVVFS